jgi:hypothetical protein
VYASSEVDEESLRQARLHTLASSKIASKTQTIELAASRSKTSKWGWADCRLARPGALVWRWREDKVQPLSIAVEQILPPPQDERCTAHVPGKPQRGAGCRLLGSLPLARSLREPCRASPHDNPHST